MKTATDPLAYLADELDELRRQNLYRPLRVMTGRQAVHTVVDGRIEIRGPTLLDGYVGEEHASTFTPDGWFATGDLGRLDADGRLRVEGRRSDLILRGGGEHREEAQGEKGERVSEEGALRPRLSAAEAMQRRRAQEIDDVSGVYRAAMVDGLLHKAYLLAQQKRRPLSVMEIGIDGHGELPQIDACLDERVRADDDRRAGCVLAIALAGRARE